MTATAECVLPGCNQAVAAVGQPCSDCRGAFGDRLRRNPDGRPLTASDIRARDGAAEYAYAAQTAATTKAAKPVRRRNQLCWLCQQRRTCTLINNLWECGNCQEVPP